MRLGMIVEGHGDSLALPSLVFRIARDRFGRDDVIMPKVPLRIRRGKFADRFDDYENGLLLLAPQVDAILVVLDSDDDDPVVLTTNLESRAATAVGHRRVGVAPAVMEYESWLLAGIAEMAGLLDVPADLAFEGDPETIRGAKGVFRNQLRSRVYSETIDQRKYSAVLDIDAAEQRSPSFKRLIDVVGRLIS